MASRTLFVIFLLCYIAGIPLVSGQEPFGMVFEISTYAETKIVVQYAFTQNVTSDAFSAGKSVWQVNIDPLVTTFTTSAADKFVWNLEIGYQMVVHQTVTIAVFSGDTPVDTITVVATSDYLSFFFEITVTEQPDYPTADELAERSIEVLQNQLAEYVAEMRHQNEVSRTNMTTQWVIVLIVFAAWIGNTLLRYTRERGKKEEA